MIDLHKHRSPRLFLFTAGLCFALACKKSPVAPPAQPPAAPDLPMPASRPAEHSSAPARTAEDAALNRALEKRYPGKPAEQEAMRDMTRQLDAKLSAEDRLAEIHRRTMVKPAPADFKPEPVARKVRLRMTLEKQKIRVGEPLRFRLEMTNVGRETIDYFEHRSSVFVKDGGMIDSLTIHFYLADGRKERRKLLPRSFPRPYPDRAASEVEGPPSGLSKKEMEKWFVETNAMGQAHATFKVKLLPGETLHSVGDDDSPVENFKTLDTQETFNEPGTYQLHVELDDRPDPLDEEYIQHALKYSTREEIQKNHARRMKKALGHVSSNAVTFEATR